jgi:hypothetical protein
MCVVKACRLSDTISAAFQEVQCFNPCIKTGYGAGAS